MEIALTQQKEKQRVEDRKKSWELLKTTSIVQALHTARDMGWKDKKVQVRVENENGVETYYVEPYEKGCGCRGILKYRNYFD